MAAPRRLFYADPMRNIALLAILSCAGCGSESGTTSTADGGQEGGVIASSSGGRDGSGGNKGTAPGGASTGGSGASTGGSGGSAGGGASTGGARSSGGATGAGGKGAGGAIGNGGSTGSGGAVSTGGTTGSGGAASTGGTTGSGGTGGASPSVGCGKPGQAGDRLLTLDVGGTTRTYLLSVPPSYANATPGPLYFVFHGYGGAHDWVTYLGFQNNSIAVFPDGLPQQGAPSGWDESPTGVDVAMFDAVLKSVEGSYCVDQRRVYAAGFSWGGWMATALGCVRGNVVRGFASVEGGVLNKASDCKGPVASWINHYKQDPSEAFASGQHSVDFFSSLNAAASPVAYDAPNPCVRYSGKAPVVFCTPDGALHDWPDYATAAIERFFAGL